MFVEVDGDLFPVSRWRTPTGVTEKCSIHIEMVKLYGTNTASRVDVTKVLFKYFEISKEFAVLICSVFCRIPIHLFTFFDKLERKGFIDGTPTSKGINLLRLMSHSILDCDMILYCNSDCDMFETSDELVTVKQLRTALKRNARAHKTYQEEICQYVNMDIVSIVLEYIFMKLNKLN